MKKLLAVVILSTFTSAAYALEPRTGLLLDVSVGYTPSILSIDSGISQGGYIGYKFNRIFSVECGYTTLLNKASAGATSAVSIAGPELAGIIRFSINDRVSPFIRVGYSKMAEKQIVGGTITGIENMVGPSYGAGLQFYETDHLSLRVGYNLYNMQTTSDYNVQSGVPINTSNTYAALLLEF